MPKITNTWIDEETGHEMAEYESGAIRDMTAARLVRGPDHALITKENAAEMAARKKQIALVSQLRGLAKSQGWDVPDDTDFERLAQLAGNAVEALTMHMAKTFRESSNLRGMGETYTKLVSPLAGEKSDEGDKPKSVSALEALGREAVEQILARAKEIREARARGE